MRRIALFVLTLGFTLTLGRAQALTPSPTGDGRLYYRIGVQALGLPANRFATTTRLPLSVELGINYRCGQFDALAGLNAAINQVVALLENIDDVIAGGLAVLPMYILQRVNPGLYDLLQNMLLRAEELVAVATKTCEQMESELARGQDPFEDWVVLSRGRDWEGGDRLGRGRCGLGEPTSARTASPGSAGSPAGARTRSRFASFTT
jgi:hypothetical protein